LGSARSGVSQIAEYNVYAKLQILNIINHNDVLFVKFSKFGEKHTNNCSDNTDVLFFGFIYTRF